MNPGNLIVPVVTKADKLPLASPDASREPALFLLDLSIAPGQMLTFFVNN